MLHVSRGELSPPRFSQHASPVLQHRTRFSQHPFRGRRQAQEGWQQRTKDGEQYEDDLNTLELDDFVVVDLLLLRRRLRQGLELFAGVENLFDETIEAGRTADGVVSVGAPRLIHGGIKLELDGSRRVR